MEAGKGRRILCFLGRDCGDGRFQFDRVMSAIGASADIQRLRLDRAASGANRSAVRMSPAGSGVALADADCASRRGGPHLSWLLVTFPVGEWIVVKSHGLPAATWK